MSYILDALRRADLERQRLDPRVPDLRVEHAPAAARRHRAWWKLLLVVLVVNAVLVTTLWYRDNSERQRLPEPAAEPSPQQPSATVGRAVNDRAADTGAPATPSPAAPGPAAVERVAEGDAGATTRAVAPPPESRLPRLAAGIPSPAPRPSTATATPVPASLEQPRPAVAADPAAVVQAEAPWWRELPTHQRSLVERPHLDVHVYDPDPGKRLIMVSLKRFGEGDELPGGARLQRITEQGIVLQHHGITYRLSRR